ncbi:MAG: hypothetical protein ABFS43_18375 [Thermodesulfobacteriota bacterium]
MDQSGNNTLAVNVVIELTPAALQAIVENAKRLAGRNEKGHYTVDTADKVGEMISRFLAENNFDSFVNDPENYTSE